MEQEQLLQSQINEIRREIGKLNLYRVRQEGKIAYRKYFLEKALKFCYKLIGWGILVSFLVIELIKLDPKL